jgi:hypothetical protein
MVIAVEWAGAVNPENQPQLRGKHERFSQRCRARPNYATNRCEGIAER